MGRSPKVRMDVVQNTCRVLFPDRVLRCFVQGTDEFILEYGMHPLDYCTKLESLAFNPERNYDDVRSFFRNCKNMYGDSGEYLSNIPDREIDFIFNPLMVLEGDRLLEMLDK